MNRLLFISRNYKKPECGGGIARTDIETILTEMGGINIGWKRTTSHNGIIHSLRNASGIVKAILSLRRDDVLVIQYQQKFYRQICRVAKRRGVKIVCLIHDLDSFRDKTLTPDQEIPLLNMADVLLTHNINMRRWLSDHGCTVPMIDYEIMDYLRGERQPEAQASVRQPYSLFFVGNLSPKLNDWIYQLAALVPHRTIYLYGGEEDAEKIALHSNLQFMGQLDDTEIIARHRGDFGISWYGSSLDSGVGKVGEYMAYNNPHKVGLYLRCGVPVVVWSKAGRADFLTRTGVALAVDSLRDLENSLSGISEADYRAMTERVAPIADDLRRGAFLRAALARVFELL